MTTLLLSVPWMWMNDRKTESPQLSFHLIKRVLPKLVAESSSNEVLKCNTELWNRLFSFMNAFCHYFLNILSLTRKVAKFICKLWDGKVARSNVKRGWLTIPEFFQTCCQCFPNRLSERKISKYVSIRSARNGGLTFESVNYEKTTEVNIECLLFPSEYEGVSDTCQTSP